MEAERCVLNYPGCCYEECSAAAQTDSVEVVFRSFIKQVHQQIVSANYPIAPVCYDLGG